MPSPSICANSCNRCWPRTTRARPHALQQPDEDVINLVAMFFDFVLDDRNLPVPIQALISRLQIPILKVALKDKAFFTHAAPPCAQTDQHDCRCQYRLGRIGSAGRRTSSTTKSSTSFRPSTSNTPTTIRCSLKSLNELQQFVQQEEHRTSLVERRTSQSIEGQAKTQQAKAVVQQLLFAKLEKLQLPSPITAFLVDQWQQLLVLIHLKNGEDSSEWLEVDASCRRSDMGLAKTRRLPLHAAPRQNQNRSIAAHRAWTDQNIDDRRSIA